MTKPNNALDVVEEQINSYLSQYPVIDEPLTKLAGQVKVKKAILAGGIILIPILILLALGTANFIM